MVMIRGRNNSWIKSFTLKICFPLNKNEQPAWQFCFIKVKNKSESWITSDSLKEPNKIFKSSLNSSERDRQWRYDEYCCDSNTVHGMTAWYDITDSIL